MPIKTAEQQAGLMLHRTRDLLVRQRTMLVNALCGRLTRNPPSRQVDGASK